MTGVLRLGIALALAVGALGCFGPEGRRPGFHLRGEVVAVPTGDWAFTNDHREIELEVHTPYLLPHSVTVWCAELDGALYVGAREPEQKRWPGWADRDPDVRLRIGSRVFEVRLAPVADAARIASVQRAYAAKYALPNAPEGERPAIRYWQVEPRS